MDALDDLRYFKNTMDGRRPLDFGDVLDFSKATKTVGTPWERRTLVLMSRAYLGGLEVGELPAGVQPWDEFALDEDPKDGL